MTKIEKATWIARARPAVAVMDRLHEQRPAVLQVGDHHHAGDAHPQLQPPIRHALESSLAQRHRSL
jgi:hypothetical protein